MSIIYDALNKTQKERQTTHQSTAFHRYHLFDIALIVIVTLLSILVLYIYYPKWSTYLSQLFTLHHSKIVNASAVKSAPPASMTPIEQAQFRSKHFLNGIFISESDKVALINNQSYHIGDTVDNLRIINIEANSVKFQDGGQVFSLQTLG